MFSSPEQYLSFGLRVNPQSPGWYESLTKILNLIKGATYTIDAEQGMALVSGRANSKSILKKLTKSGIEVAWIKTGKPSTYGGHGHGHGPYLQYPYQYHHRPTHHHNSNYYDPYGSNPPHFEPYSYYSTRHY
ncbi:hypothetical protein F3Y22_tig00111502pilonHSYRG00015 [Hibiscus syriacus]|uniref:HMA domain-containing protein n=1 Tax=Hibiscus syriacus TaxID=106335 RepID=A0A6A2XQB7_HIBSY|nr:hypothetical protein F3Y22_tig00111502pilonHSYRG00015 [Hibiscus syriacus]